MSRPGIISHYFGRAGHLFVMSEFLLRGWNVAIPEVDQGDDIFVVKHEEGELRRVQVKSANAKQNQTKTGYTAQFNISKAIIFPPIGRIHIALAVRHENAWQHLFVIDSTELQDFLAMQESHASTTVNLTLALNGKKITCRGKDFSAFKNQFKDFPVSV